MVWRTYGAAASESEESKRKSSLVLLCIATRKVGLDPQRIYFFFCCSFSPDYPQLIQVAYLLRHLHPSFDDYDAAFPKKGIHYNLSNFVIGA